MALCGSGALFRQEGNFLFFPARFYQEPDPTATPSPAPSPSEEPQPSSSPTPSLTPTPEPSPTPADPTISPSPSDNPDGIAIDGEWLVMPAGTTVETVVAVSYTHLDVYKRQVYRSGLACRSCS